MARCLKHEQVYETYCCYCGSPEEQVYTIQEVSEKLKISETRAREIFHKELPGIIELPHKGYNPRKETRTHIRIPHAVYQRVKDRMEKLLMRKAMVI